jgi:hypothetical protein
VPFPLIRNRSLALGVVSLLFSFPAMWNISPTENLTASAKYFARPINHYGLSSSNATAAYNAGPGGAAHGAGQSYQNAFNQHLGIAQNLVNCMH